MKTVQVLEVKRDFLKSLKKQVKEKRELLRERNPEKVTLSKKISEIFKTK